MTSIKWSLVVDMPVKTKQKQVNINDLLNDQTVQFQTIQFSISQQSKWWQVLVCITNDSTKQ